VEVQLRSAAQDRAYEIAVQWADLETAGHLPQYKEKSISGQFLGQFFGEGLGYQVKTASPDDWQMEYEFHVKDVGAADAALGQFPKLSQPLAVMELKGAMTDLDRDRSNGRTAVQQCWDYLNALTECPWGIVSNFRTIRLYHREKGTLSYEEFDLQELRNRARFDQFYFIFERGGLLPSRIGQGPRALELLRKTADRQKGVGDQLYREYQWRRLELIEHLNRKEGKDLNEAIRIAQKLLDRIIFIAFCEDRELLPEHSLEITRTEIRPYSRAKNPAWENFLDLFAAIDKGAKGRREIFAFNGGLFADDPTINALELAEEKWTNAFAGFGNYDFSEEVNVSWGTSSSARSRNWKNSASAAFMPSGPAWKMQRQPTARCRWPGERRPGARRAQKPRRPATIRRRRKRPRAPSGSGSASITRPPPSPA
jgi:hypothetical protein